MVNNISLYILPLIILGILTLGLLKRVCIYEEFIEGAKDGFSVSVSIIPYLVAIIVAVSMFRASGAIDLISNFLVKIFCNTHEHFINDITQVLPIMLTRSLSGSATLGVFSDIASKFGGEAFVTKMAAVMVGSSETTFYVLSVYFGSIGIKKYRYALLTGIIADIIGIVLAILVSRLFFLANSGL